MTSKKLAGFIAFLTAAFISVHAAELSPGTGIFFVGSAGLKYDSNIFLTQNNTKSSAVYELTPGVEFDLGAGSLTKNVFTFSETFVSYSSASDQNTNLANAKYVLDYSDSKASFNLDAEYHQIAQNTRDVHFAGHILQTDVIHIGPQVELAVSPKTSFGAGVIYENYKYDISGYANRSTVTVPLDVYYEIVPKVQGSVGYRYRSNSVDAPGLKSDDNYFSVGARGEFDPKLSGSFSVGYNQRKINAGTVRGIAVAGRTESGLGLDAKLDYLYSEKTKLQLTAREDFNNAATGDSEKVFELGAGLSSALTNVVTADASLHYGQYKYVASTRSDDYYRLQAGLTYSCNANVKVNGTYGYQDNSSNFSGLSFKGNVFGVSVAVRY
jgi:hypothetical protein